MANGKVDFFNDTGGYGFIETEDEDDDVFFHMEDVGGEDLTEGTEIEFDIEQAPQGPARDQRRTRLTTASTRRRLATTKHKFSQTNDLPSDSDAIHSSRYFPVSGVTARKSGSTGVACRPVTARAAASRFRIR